MTPSPVSAPPFDCVECQTGPNLASTILWLYGLIDSGKGFVPIVPELVHPDWCSPGLACAALCVPRAPERAVTITGGMRMDAWYDIAHLDLANRATAGRLPRPPRARAARPHRPTECRASITWARRLKRVFGIDIGIDKWQESRFARPKAAAKRSGTGTCPMKPARPAVGQCGLLPAPKTQW